MTFAAFKHHTAREGYEVVFVEPNRYEGQSTGVEEGQPFALRYAIEVDDAWRTRRAEVTGRHETVVLESDGEGHWRVNERSRPDLDGCVDVDLEGSAFTNAFPVARGATDAPAAWVRLDLSVERLEQTYARAGERTYDYESPGFRSRIVFGADGIVVEYPGIATRTH